jgi:hypothetical protein
MAVAYIYIWLGEIDKAFDWLEKAGDERDGMIINILVVDILFDPLRSHRRYQALLRKMNRDLGNYVNIIMAPGEQAK